MKVTFNIGITGCSNYEVHLIKGSECLLYPCKIDDSGNITVEVIPGCSTNLCIEGEVICKDNACDNCSVPFRKCLCDENGECTEPCTTCVNGLCEPICPDQVCDDNKCVDCSDEFPCIDGKVCLNGKCVCPVDKPVTHPVTGKCVECIPGTIVNCMICNDGFWEPIDCGTGVCDPVTDKCEECVSTSDCDKPHEICLNGDCVCGPGYERDPVTGNCIEKPSCTRDSECGDCEICVDGTCVPLECPPDHVCENGKCVYNPCPDTPCSNGTECGDDCGCNEVTGFCEPCSTNDCGDKCDSLLGCDCINGKCDKVEDCFTTCSSYIDCDEGCGCDDGICRNCENYSCTDCAEINGCGCIDGTCQDVDPTCQDKLTLEDDGCTVKAELVTSLSCPCPAITLVSEIVGVTPSEIANGSPIETCEFEILVSADNNHFGGGDSIVQWGSLVASTLNRLIAEENLPFFIRTSPIRDTGISDSIPITTVPINGGDLVTDNGTLNYGIRCVSSGKTHIVSTPALVVGTTLGLNSNGGQFWEFVNSATGETERAKVASYTAVQPLLDFIKTDCPCASESNNNVNNLFDFKVSLRKGISTAFATARTLPLLGDTTHPSIVDNDKPTSGTIKITIQPFYKVINNLGRVTSRITGSIDEFTSSAIDRDEITFSDLEVPNPGYEISTGTFVDYVLIKVTQSSNLEFPNGCIYTAVNTISSLRIDEDIDITLLSISTVEQDKLGGFITLTTQGERNPVFTWHKSSDNIFNASEIFRKVYVPKVGNKNIDILHGPEEIPSDVNLQYPLIPEQGEIWAGYDYQVSIDCSCDNVKNISDLQLCDIEFEEDVHYQMTDCNTKFVGLQSFIPCPINRDLSQYESATYDIPDDAQTYYELYIDGVLRGNFIYDDNQSELKDVDSNLLLSNFTYTSTSSIQEVKLTQNHGTTCDVVKTFDLDIPIPTYTVLCVAGSKYTAVVDITSVSGYSVSKIISGASEFIPAGNFVTVTDLTKGQDTSVTVVYSNDCTIELVIQEDCCAEADFTIDLGGAVTIPEGETVAGSFTDVINFADTFASGNLDYYLDDVLLADETFNLTVAGTYTFKVIDTNGCEKEKIVTISSTANDSTFTLVPSTICTGAISGGILTVSGTPGTDFTYTTPSTTVNGTIDGSGSNTYEVFSAGSYTLTDYGPFTGLTEEVILTVVSTPSVTSVTPEAGPYCEGQPIDFTIVGTPGATVDISYPDGGSGPAQTVLVGGNDVITYVPSVTGSNTISVDQVTVGTCVEAISETSNVTVVATPTITSFTATCQSASPTSDVDLLVIGTASATVTVDVAGGGATAMVEGLAGNYALTVSDKGSAVVNITLAGCSDEQTFTINECDCPVINTPTTGEDTHKYCGAVVPQGSVSISGGATLARWYSDIGLTTLVNTGLTYTPAAGSARFYIVGEDAAGCQSSPLTMTFSQVTLTSSGFGGDATPCEGTSNVYTVTPSSSSDVGFPNLSFGSFDYVWYDAAGGSGGAGSIIGTNSSSITVDSDIGTISVDITSTQAATCSATQDIVITETVCDPCFASDLSVVVADVSNACYDTSIVITPTVTLGTAPYSYLWTVLTGDLSSIDSATTGATLTISPDQTSTYQLTVTDDDGCIEFDTFTVSVNSAVVVNANSTSIDVTDSCDGPLVATASGGTGSGYTYKWYKEPLFPISSTLVSNSASYNPRTDLTPGEFSNFRCLVTDSAGCTGQSIIGYSECPHVFQVIFNVTDVGTICEDWAIFDWSVINGCELAQYTGDWVLNGTILGTGDLGIGNLDGSVPGGFIDNNGCHGLQTAGTNWVINADLLIAGTNTLEYKVGATVYGTVDFTPAACPVTAVELSGGPAVGNCISGNCNGGANISVNLLERCDAFDITEETQLFKDGIAFGSVIAPSTITHDGLSCGSTTIVVESVGISGTCPPNGGTATITLKDTATELVVYATMSLQLVCTP